MDFQCCRSGDQNRAVRALLRGRSLIQVHVAFEVVLSPSHTPSPNASLTELETLKDLYIDELNDLYSAEQQLVQACTKWRKWPVTKKALQSIYLTSGNPMGRRT